MAYLFGIVGDTNVESDSFLVSCHPELVSGGLHHKERDAEINSA